MKLIAILLTITILGCRNNNHEDSKVITENDSSRSNLDSIKWLMYALNSPCEFTAWDSSLKQTVKINPVDCEVELLRKFNNASKLWYLLCFRKKECTGIVSQCLYVDAIGVSNGFYLPSFSHAILEFTKYPDSVRVFIHDKDSSFRSYLRTYKGNLCPWLRQEAIRRGIIAAQ